MRQLWAGGRRGVAGGRGCTENAKTNADKEKARKQMLTVLEAATALTEAPSSVKSLVCDRLGTNTFQIFLGYISKFTIMSTP